jgi:flagellar basal-body rod protein FlgB
LLFARTETATVNAISDNAILTALGRQMTKAVARQTVAASNLANIDTPGYHTREATFGDALDSELSMLAEAHEVDGLPSKRDGNNVQIDRELLGLNRAAADFSAAQTALSAKFRLVRYAINEGR